MIAIEWLNFLKFLFYINLYVQMTDNKAQTT